MNTRIYSNHQESDIPSVNPRRGEIYWIQSFKTVGSEQMPNRPAIIVSNDENNIHSSTVEIVYITTAAKKDLPTHCIIRSAYRPSIALCEQVTTISKIRIGDLIGKCSIEEMKVVSLCMMVSLGIHREVLESTEDTDQECCPIIEETDLVESYAEEMKDMTDHEKSILLAKLETEAEVYRKMYYSLLDRYTNEK